MTTMTASAEVAEDFRNSLEDLTFNSRWEIVNLTTIARENIIHAQAIARVIQDQIKTVTPSRKLPTFYLLDSIVKNVGTPYTLYFGRDLCPMFMAAYVVVDHQIRRKLEEMLQTWKLPLPGAVTAQPVFPVEVTMKIDQILAKARIAGMQPSQYGHLQTQQPIRIQPQAQPVYPQQIPNPQMTAYPQRQAMQNNYYGSNPQPLTAQPQIPPRSTFSPSNGVQALLQPQSNLDSLRHDLSALIEAAKADWSRNMADTSIVNHLKALLDLDHIMSTQVLGPEQYVAIRDRITSLARSPSSQATVSNGGQHVMQPMGSNMMNPPEQRPTLDSLLGAGNIAALLASANGRGPNPTPPPPISALPFQTSQPPFDPSNAATSSPMVNSAAALLEAFKAAGVVTGQQSASAPSLSALMQPGQGLFFNTPPQIPALPPTTLKGFNILPEIVPLTSASLKIERPQLIGALYSGRGNQCHTCGRRFMLTEEGKRRKAAHLDWHFKVNQRMSEATKRGQNRSWYVDEHEWIRSPPADLDEDLAALQIQEKTAARSQANGTTNGAAAAKKKERFVPVPNDPSTNQACPVCMEPFVPSWLDSAQRFVYMDTVKAGEKIYHVSCFEAVRSANDAAAAAAAAVEASRTSTPDSTLVRKRKAEMAESPRVKMLKEIAV